MFSFFERLLAPTAAPENPEPPTGLVAFFWHYARQAKGLFIGLFVAGFFVALLDSLIPVFVGRIITLITATPPDELFEKFWPDRKSTRLNSSHIQKSRMPSSA